MVEPHFLPVNAPYWLIDGIPVSLDGAQPRPQPGETDTYDIALKPDTAGALDGTGWSDHVERYRELRDHARHSQTVNIDVTIDDKVVYSVGHNDFDPLVSVRPGEYDDVGTGIWGLVTDVEDPTTLSEAIAQLSIEVAFIAEYSRYDSKQAVRAAHERRGFH